MKPALITNTAGAVELCNADAFLKAVPLIGADPDPAVTGHHLLFSDNVWIDTPLKTHAEIVEALGGTLGH